MMVPVWISGIALLITFSIFLSHVIFKMGHISARVEELETWRISIRNDMHEISDKLSNISTELHALSILVAERTERRTSLREDL